MFRCFFNVTEADIWGYSESLSWILTGVCILPAPTEDVLNTRVTVFRQSQLSPHPSSQRSLFRISQVESSQRSTWSFELNRISRVNSPHSCIYLLSFIFWEQSWEYILVSSFIRPPWSFQIYWGRIKSTGGSEDFPLSCFFCNMEFGRFLLK